MSFVSTDPQGHKGQTDIWLTPLDLISRIGTFDYDPCPFIGHKTAKHLEPNDGLKSKWVGCVWLNPPYSEADAWLTKLSEHGFGCALVFARTGSKYMQKHLRSCDNVMFLKGRIKFLKPDGTTLHNAGADSMLLLYGMKPKDKTLGVLF